MQLALRILPNTFSIHRLPPNSPIPEPVLNATLYCIARTNEELSIVCDSDLEIESSDVALGWRGLQVIGPLDFSLTGVLAGIAKALAAANISIFAFSTFNTDYLLVRIEQLQDAVNALQREGYKFPDES